MVEEGGACTVSWPDGSKQLHSTGKNGAFELVLATKPVDINGEINTVLHSTTMHFPISSSSPSIGSNSVSMPTEIRSAAKAALWRSGRPPSPSPPTTTLLGLHAHTVVGVRVTLNPDLSLPDEGCGVVSEVRNYMPVT